MPPGETQNPDEIFHYVSVGNAGRDLRLGHWYSDNNNNINDKKQQCQNQAWISGAFLGCLAPAPRIGQVLQLIKASLAVPPLQRQKENKEFIHPLVSGEDIWAWFPPTWQAGGTLAALL